MVAAGSVVAALEGVPVITGMSTPRGKLTAEDMTEPICRKPCAGTDDTWGVATAGTGGVANDGTGGVATAADDGSEIITTSSSSSGIELVEDAAKEDNTRLSS